MREFGLSLSMCIVNQNGKFNLVNDGQLCQTCHNLPLNKHQLHVYCIMHVHTVIIIYIFIFSVICGDSEISH